MQLKIDQWRTRLAPRLSRPFPYWLIEAGLIVLLAFQCARLIWIIFAPVGPVGSWMGQSSASLGGIGTLESFDPFSRNSGQAGTVVTSLPLKLFGVRVDQATGRGSAIIATPDGDQQSFAVGDDIMPGVRLKGVTRDSVTIDRGGAAEQLFLDQSVSAPVAELPAAAAATLPATPPAPAIGQRPIGKPPVVQNGVVTGFAIAPKQMRPSTKIALANFVLQS